MNNHQYSFSEWKHLLDLPPPVILDVGANDLGTSLAFKKLFPDAYIHAFEPDPRAIIHGEQNLERMKLWSERIIYHHCAVGEIESMRYFYPSNGFNPNCPWYDSGYDLSGSLLKPVSSVHPGLETVYFDSPIQVRCITLNTWLKSFKPRKIDLIHMDVQGAELEVIRGGDLAFKMAKWVFLECMDAKVYENQPTLNELSAHLPYHRLIKSYHGDGNHLFRRIF